MATTCTYLSYGASNGRECSVVSGTISQDDRSFLKIVNPLAPEAVSVTADKIRSHTIGVAAANTAGIPPGDYEKVSGATYKLVK